MTTQPQERIDAMASTRCRLMQADVAAKSAKTKLSVWRQLRELDTAAFANGEMPAVIERAYELLRAEQGGAHANGGTS